MPSFKQVPLASVKVIDFSHKDSSHLQQIPDELFTESEEPYTSMEIHSLISDCIEGGHTPVLASMVEPYSSAFCVSSNRVSNTRQIPSYMEESRVRIINLASIRDEKLQHNSLTELQELALLTDIGLSIDDCSFIEDISKRCSDQRRYVRLGRITGTTFKSCVKTNIIHPSKTILKAICYPEKVQFTSSATEYGKKHEKDALAAIKVYLEKHHENFQMTECGFIIDNKIPYIGSSPDSLCSCECCGLGVIEVKAPYSLRNGEKIESMKITDPFLIKSAEGEIIVNAEHSYFYQMQLQMQTTNRRYCHFGVWNPKHFKAFTIERNDLFLQEKLRILKDFYFKVILPELLGQYFSNHDPNFFVKNQ